MNPFELPILETLEHDGIRGDVRFDEKNGIYYVELSTKFLFCVSSRRKEVLKEEFINMVNSVHEAALMIGDDEPVELYESNPDVCDICANHVGSENVTFCKCCGSNFCKKICGNTEDHICIVCQDMLSEDDDYFEESN